MGKNRVLEAKRLKIIAQRRARPRALRMNNGYQRVHQSVDRSKIPKEAQALFAYRDRLKLQDERLHFIVSVMSILYPDYSRPVIEERAAEHIRLQIKPVARKLLLQNGRNIKIALLANEDKDCFEFLQLETIAGILRRSITYSSEHRAYEVFHLQTIRWKETINLLQPPSSPPP